jgi:hypothetical protein
VSGQDQDLLHRSPSAVRVEASGDRSVAAQELIAQVVNTGDHNTFFVGDYEALRFAYRWPREVFEAIPADRFVGRRWLCEAIDVFMEAHDRGYIVVQGPAGVGKTAFLADLVRERGYVHHFVGPPDAGTALRSLAAQLIRAYELTPFTLNEMLPSAVVQRPEFFGELLWRAAGRVGEEDPPGSVVIAIDGLDEAETPPGLNALGLPRSLPPHTYVIVSMRPVYVRLQTSEPREVLRIEPSAHDNVADLRSFLEQAARRPAVAAALQRSGDGMDAFVERVLERSEGVWAYAFWVVEAVERDPGGRVDLEALPQGLYGYYAAFWRRWRVQDGAPAPRADWYDLYLPLAATLAAVREPVTWDQLAKLADREGRPEVVALLDELWSPFVAGESDGVERRYRFYHASVADFLAGRLPPGSGSVDDADVALSREVAAATRSAHDRIADRYVAAWGGLDAGLPKLTEAHARDLDGRYGLRNVVAHLFAARPRDGHRMLCMEREIDGGWVNTWYMAHDDVDDAAGYLNDIAVALSAATRSTRKQIAAGRPATGMALQYGYALIGASVAELAQHIPSPLRVALVRHGIWSPTHALVDAQQLLDGERALALADLARHLDGPEGDTAFVEALRAARAISDTSERVEALGNVVSLVDDSHYAGLLTELLETARTISDQRRRQEAMITWIPVRTEADHERVVAEIVAAARNIEDAKSAAFALVKAADYVPAPERDCLLDEALDAARAIDWDWLRAGALADVADRLTGDQRDRVLHEALEVAREVLDDGMHVIDLLDIATLLREGERDGVLSEALDAARAIGSDEGRARALARVARSLTEPQRTNVAKTALQVASALDPADSRGDALAALAKYLPETLIPQLFSFACPIDDEHYRAEALCAVAKRLPESLMPEALHAADALGGEYRAQVLTVLAERVPDSSIANMLALARAISQDAGRMQVIDALAPRLPGALVAETLQVARAISDEYARACALPRLAQTLPDPQRRRVIDSALQTASGISETEWRIGALLEIAHVLPEDEQASVLTEALQTARAINELQTRVRMLRYIAQRLPDVQREGVLSEALQAARALTDDRWRPSVIVELLAVLPESLTEQGLELAAAVNDELRAEALQAVASRLPESLTDQALDAAQALGDHTVSRVIARVAEGLPEPLVRHAVELALQLDHEPRAFALSALAERLPPSERARVLHEALHAARAIGIEPSGLLAELDIAAQVRDSNLQSRLGALWAVAERLDPIESEGVMREALESVRAIDSEESRARTLDALAGHIPDALLDTALQIALEISDSKWRAAALYGIAECLPETQQERALTKAVDAARAIVDANARAYALCRLAEIVPERLRDELLRESLDAAGSVSAQDERTLALAAVVDHTAESSELEQHRAWAELIDACAAGAKRDRLLKSGAVLRPIAMLGDAGTATAAASGSDELPAGGPNSGTQPRATTRRRENAIVDGASYSGDSAAPISTAALHHGDHAHRCRNGRRYSTRPTWRCPNIGGRASPRRDLAPIDLRLPESDGGKQQSRHRPRLIIRCRSRTQGAARTPPADARANANLGRDPAVDVCHPCRQ